jgi:hypothetical protein
MGLLDVRSSLKSSAGFHKKTGDRSRLGKLLSVLGSGVVTALAGYESGVPLAGAAMSCSRDD